MAKEIVIREIRKHDKLPEEGIVGIYRVRMKNDAPCQVCQEDIKLNEMYIDVHDSPLPISRICQGCCLEWD